MIIYMVDEKNLLLYVKLSKMQVID